MKHVFIIVGILVHAQLIPAGAQIVFEHKYDSAAYDNNFTQDGIFLPVRIYQEEIKYAEIDDNQIILYNLNHTVFKVMTIPMSNFNNENVNYISSALFDTDSTTIEFMVEGQDSAGIYGVYVFREDGTLVFTEPNISMAPSVMILFPQAKPFPTVYNTPQGTKMMLVRFSGTVRVYGLPGTYYELTGPQEPAISEWGRMIDIKPNPVDGFLDVSLNIPHNFTNPVLQVYSAKGESLESITIGSQRRSMQLNTLELPPGIYFLRIMAENGASKALKFVKK